MKCWRASSVVGTTTATCLPVMAATKAARSATSVLPKPTSPQISRSIGRPGAEIVDHVGDGRLLVVGLVVGKARRRIRRRRRSRRVSRGASCNARAAATLISSPAISRIRFFIRALRGCQAVAAEPVELDAGLFRAVARQKLDVLDRQEQLVAAGIVDFETIMRRAGGLDGAQADEAADAMIDMDDKIAGGQGSSLRR